MTPLDLDGAHLFTPRIHLDERGSFHEWFRFADLPMPLAQANLAVSHRGVLRGMHYAPEPPGQAKYVICVTGAIIDLAYDPRRGSPTEGRSQQVRLDAENRHAAYLPAGLAHGYLALADDTTVVYLCSEPYDPAGEQAIHPLDPALGLDLPAMDLILSAKDRAAPTLAELEKRSLLPDHAAFQKATV